MRKRNLPIALTVLGLVAAIAVPAATGTVMAEPPVKVEVFAPRPGDAAGTGPVRLQGARQCMGAGSGRPDDDAVLERPPALRADLDPGDDDRDRHADGPDLVAPARSLRGGEEAQRQDEGDDGNEEKEGCQVRGHGAPTTSSS